MYGFKGQFIFKHFKKEAYRTMIKVSSLHYSMIPRLPPMVVYCQLLTKCVYFYMLLRVCEDMKGSYVSGLTMVAWFKGQFSI